MAKRPNILLITSDQQHHDTIGKFNSKIQTPSLDKLCNEGMNFTRAYCPSPVCTPSRASIITGQYPSSHGAWTIGVKLEETVETIGELLYKNGYSTGLIGKAHFQPLTSVPGQESIEGQPTLRDLEFWKNFKGPWYGFEHIELARNHADESHVGQHYAIWMEQNGLSDWKEYFQPVPGETSKYAPPIAREYDYWARPDRVWQLDEKHHYTNWTAERSIEFLDQQKDDKPFFLWTSFQDPHPPYVLSDPWASMYNPSDMSPGTLKEGEHDLNPPHFGKTQTANPDFENWHSPFNAHGCMSHLYPMEELKKDMAIYYGMISFMDKNIGKIINKLDQMGELDNTIIIFTTDHGHFIGQHGLIAKGPFHYEDMLRLPFIVRWPDKVPQNTSIKGDEFRRVIVVPANRVSQSPWTSTYFYRDLKFDGLTGTAGSSVTGYADKNLPSGGGGYVDPLTGNVVGFFGKHYLANNTIDVNVGNSALNNPGQFF